MKKTQHTRIEIEKDGPTYTIRKVGINAGHVYRKIGPIKCADVRFMDDEIESFIKSLEQ